MQGNLINLWAVAVGGVLYNYKRYKNAKRRFIKEAFGDNTGAKLFQYTDVEGELKELFLTFGSQPIQETRGRKKLTDDQLKKCRSMYLTDEEHYKLMELAKAAGLTPSELITKWLTEF